MTDDPELAKGLSAPLRILAALKHGAMDLDGICEALQDIPRTMGLYHRKTNLGRLGPPVGLRPARILLMSDHARTGEWTRTHSALGVGSTVERIRKRSSLR